MDMNKSILKFAVALLLSSGAGILVLRLITGDVNFGMAYAFTIICACTLARPLLMSNRENRPSA